MNETHDLQPNMLFEIYINVNINQTQYNIIKNCLGEKHKRHSYHNCQDHHCHHYNHWQAHHISALCKCTVLCQGIAIHCQCSLKKISHNIENTTEFYSCMVLVLCHHICASVCWSLSDAHINELKVIRYNQKTCLVVKTITVIAIVQHFNLHNTVWGQFDPGVSFPCTAEKQF